MKLILDTNILLLDAYNLVNLGEHEDIIVIPETVLDEIDSKKSGFSEIAYQARQFSRLLSKANDVEIIRKDGNVTSVLELNGREIHLISSRQASKNFDIVDTSILNDRKIINAALWVEGDKKFITNDIACKHRAKSEGLVVEELREVDEVSVEFTKTLQLSDEDFRSCHNKNIVELDPEYEPNFFNYSILNVATGQVKLATIRNGLVDVIGKDSEKELRRQDINPANSGQLFFSKALQDPAIDITVCEAKAGSGKTAIAISNGIRMVRQGHYDSLIYIRASVDDVDESEKIGFLAGNDEKVQVYLHPLEDTLDFIVRNRYKDTKLKADQYEKMVEEKIEETKAQCNIEAMIGLGMRGRTFHNAYVIIDEAQNQSKSSIQKMLTRFGTGCKIVVIGSQAQIDNAYINKYTNGLSVLLDACTREHDRVNLHAVSLPKVLRGPIAEFAEDLYSNK